MNSRKNVTLTLNVIYSEVSDVKGPFAALRIIFYYFAILVYLIPEGALTVVMLICLQICQN